MEVDSSNPSEHGLRRQRLVGSTDAKTLPIEAILGFIEVYKVY